MVWKIIGDFDYSADCAECLQLDFVRGTNDVDVSYNV